MRTLCCVGLVVGTMAIPFNPVRAGQVGVVEIPEQALENLIMVVQADSATVTFSNETEKAVITVPKSDDVYRFMALDADGKNLGEIEFMVVGEDKIGILILQVFAKKRDIRRISVETQSSSERIKLAANALAKLRELAAGDKKDQIGALLPFLAGDKLSSEDLKLLRATLQGKGEKTWVLLDFWAEWCHGCLAILPEVRSITTDFAGKLTVGSIDLTRSIGRPMPGTTKPQAHADWIEIVGPTDDFSEDWWQMVTGLNNRSIPYFVLISPEGQVFELNQQSLRAQIEKHIGPAK